MRYNPFQPGQIATPQLFGGRSEQLAVIENSLFQTKCGNPLHFLIHGERAIGKSSLMLYAEHLAKGSVVSSTSMKYSFVTVHIELAPSDTCVDLVHKIGAELSRSVKSHSSFMTLLKSGWDFLSRWEILGVKYDRTPHTSARNTLFGDLCTSILDATARIKSHCDGLMILIDECDKPPVEVHLGAFAKLFTERLSRNGVKHVVLGLSGISTVLEKMRKSHESSPRIFQQLPLNQLRPAEGADIVNKGISEANFKNNGTVAIDDKVVKWISERGSQGYPHFIQEYAHAAFDANTDDFIDMRDLEVGVYRENGALIQLGKKYFENMYVEQIFSDEYRLVLRAMSGALDGYVSKAQLRSETGLKECTLNNALAALKERNIIIPKQGSRGLYRLPSRAFAVWIKAFASSQPNWDRDASEPIVSGGHSILDTQRLWEFGGEAYFD